MSKQYYIQNMCWGWFYGATTIFLFFDSDIKEYTFLMFFVVSIIGIVLYPLAKFAVESFFLKFTTREFWNKGLFMDTAGKAGGLAVYGGVIFLLSIPITMVFIITIFIKRLLVK